MKIQTGLFVAGLIIGLNFSCKNYSHKYEVVHYKKSKNNKIHMYIVYSPDTNWTGMSEFAANLVKGKGNGCAVGFFSPKNKIPDIDSNFNLIPNNSLQFLLGTYRFDNESSKYKLIR